MAIQEDIIAGVGPGGLRDMHDVKILICYLLRTLQRPFPREKLMELLSADGISDYFTVSAAFDELRLLGHLQESRDGWSLTPLGEQTASALQSSLPAALRERIAAEAAEALSRLQRESEVRTGILPHQDGYHVCCTMQDGPLEFLKLSFYAPDLEHAGRIQRRLKEQSTELYMTLMKMLT